MLQLSGEDFNKLVDIIGLVPSFANAFQRYTWVYNCLKGSPRAKTLMGGLNLGVAPPHIDAIDLVHRLLNFGQDEPGHEVITMIIQGILNDSGESEDTIFLRGLLERYPLETVSTGGKQIAILFAAANPIDQARIRTDVEYKKVSEVLRESRYRDRFSLTIEPALQVLDLPGALLRIEPSMVHFSGHGEQEGLLAEKEGGATEVIPPEALKQLFATLSHPVRVVLLNACFSEPQAEMLKSAVDCVIGMSRAIGDEAAILFSAGFYQALGYGESVQKAFDCGVNRMALAGSGQSDTPKFLYRSGVTPTDIRLA